MSQLSKVASRFQEKLRELGFQNEVKELPDSTRTAKEAAATIGCDVAQIAKSIIFRLESSGEPLLVVASGVNRIDEGLIGEVIGDQLGNADADFVREQTGYVIGGVPPLGHQKPIQTLIDEDLFQFDVIWAAAGHPKAVFSLTAEELREMTSGEVVAVR